MRLCAIALLAVFPACPNEVWLFDGGALDAASNADAMPSGPDGGDGGGGRICPPVNFGIGPKPDPIWCAANLAAKVLWRPLCACDDVTLRGELTTTSFDSTGALVPPQHGASVASNRSFTSTGTASIGGALEVKGAIVGDAGEWTVTDWLKAGSTVQTASRIEVGADAWVAGSITGALSVKGVLHLNPGADKGGAMAAGGIDDTKVILFPPPWPPCDCIWFNSFTYLFNEHANKNDNAAIGLAADALTGVSPLQDVDLPCGEYFLVNLGSSGDLRLHVSGHTALFIDGGITLAGSLDVVLVDPGAELDIVANGTLQMRGGHIGNLAQPARVRLWLNENATTITLDDHPTLAVGLNAPSASIVAEDGFDLVGAARVHGVTTGTIGDPTKGRVKITYDHAIFTDGRRTCPKIND